MDKKNALHKIVRLPLEINKFLLMLNGFPQLFYGTQYLKRKHSIQRDSSTPSAKKVIDIVNYAIQNIPYYNNLYKYPISSIEEFTETIGFINRDTLLDHYSDLINPGINNNEYLEMTTGGTSGKPAKFLIPKNRHIVELSTLHTLWERAGWKYHIRGVIRNDKLSENEIYRINPITKEVIFDSFRLNPQYVRQIVEVLHKYKIQFIFAYPSAAYQFCKLSRSENLHLGFLKAIICSSEAVFDFQKRLIVDELGLKLFSFYGHSEKLIVGGYCEHSDDFHMEMQYGYFELVGGDNKPINTPGQFGEIVGTTLYNYGMPLIRYRTGDYAEYVGDYCEACGRKMPVIRNIQGRWDKNQIYRKDGTYITTTALNLHSDLYSVIEGLQYIQKQPGSLIVLIIKGDSFKPEHEKLFNKHYSESMGKESEVRINYVNNLIYQPNGKFVQLISDISLQP